MRCLYFDCFSGAAGDMLCAALLDLGAPLAGLQEDLARLGLKGLAVGAERRWQGGLAGTRFIVRIDPATPQPPRNLPAIRSLIGGSGLPVPVIERALRVFTRLGEAEAKVHGCGLDDVHFHEVGALDSIADVVGFCALHQRLGAPRLYASPVAVGEGFVQTDHGLLPVPALATLELLRGVPIAPSTLREELCTPTGAALLSTLCDGFGRHFSYVPRAVGYGLGMRERASPPNAVRVIDAELIHDGGGGGEGNAGGDEVVCLETSLDDATGQEIGRLMDECLARGALDVVAFPVLMKKGRPGQVVQVLAGEAVAPAIEELLLADSTTLGVRSRRMRRRTLPRVQEIVRTSLGDVRVKVATVAPGAFKAAAEFDDLARLAHETKLPLAEVRRRIEPEIQAEVRRRSSAR